MYSAGELSPAYVLHSKGVEILDLYPSKDFKTGQDVLVFIVNRNDSRSVYEEWKELRIKK